MNAGGQRSSALSEVVCLGGGNGSPALLRSLMNRFPYIPMAAVVASTDNGRSSGVVRDALKMPAPGDLRHCISTLAAGTSPWAEVLEQRISAPGHPALDGIAVGNVILAAFAQHFGNLAEAGYEVMRLLGMNAIVHPVSVENIHLGAELSDGTRAHGELAVRQTGKARIRQVFIEGESEGIWSPARRVLESASTLIIGPGSLWTSLAATLAVKGVREAIPARTRVIFVCNTTTQPGQTDGFDVADHVEVIARSLGRAPDVAVINAGEPPASLADALQHDGLNVLGYSASDAARVDALGCRALAADFIAHKPLPSPSWQKLGTANYDMGVVAEALVPYISPESSILSARAGAVPRR